MRKERQLTVYTVVEVWRGLADGARTFASERDARRYMRAALRRRSPFEDDVRMFEGTLALHAGPQFRRGVERRALTKSGTAHRPGI
jgi:hypothetical protein